MRRNVFTVVFLIVSAVCNARVQADYLFVVSRTTNEAYRYQVDQNGTPILERTLTTNLDRPGGFALSPTGELFVTNIGDVPGTGSVARFNDAAGMATPNGTIPNNQSVPGFSFSRPYEAGFRGNELFVANFEAKVLRFTFDGSGQAVSNGIVTDLLIGGGVRGLTISPTGDLFVSQLNNSSLEQYSFDGAGNSHFVREFSFGAGTIVHGIVFSPWGELFAANPSGNDILRYLFDGVGNPIFNGSISGNGLNYPLGLSFSSWGELFVGNNGAAQVSRFTFDAAHNASANGSFAVPYLTGNLLFAPGLSAVPEPSSMALMGLGGFAVLAKARRRKSAKPGQHIAE